MAKNPKILFRKSKKFSSRVRKIFAKPGNFASKTRRVIPKVLKVFRQGLTNFALSQQIFVDCPRTLRQQSESYQKKSAIFFKIPKEFQQNPKKTAKFPIKKMKLRTVPTKSDNFLSIVREFVAEGLKSVCQEPKKNCQNLIFKATFR